MPFTPRVAHLTHRLRSAARLGPHRSSPRKWTRPARVGLSRQIALCTYHRNVYHCAAMTSPCLVASTRAFGTVDDYPFGPHQMTAWAAQRRRSCPPSRWEPHQFTDRRHRATVSVIPACDIKKSRGLAEKISACRLSTAGLGQAERPEYSEFSRAGNTTEC